MSQFGKYVLQRKLAEGGMAEVFLAHQTGLEGFEKPVVVKRILPNLTSEASFVQMFLNEARVAARLNHPNIVQIFELGIVDGQYFIAMEFVNGENLRDIARQADKIQLRPPVPLTCRMMAETLAGLHYAHTRTGADGNQLGLVHRDVSPQNVLITFDGGVKLVDFGIAKATQSQGAEQTQTGLLKGKYAYMSPEQARGQPLDARADVFTVGILLWELLTWNRLFKRGSDMATLLAVADEEIPSPRRLEPSVPAQLDDIVMRALARPLDQRYPSAQAMRADLEALIRTEGWEADTLALERYMHSLFADRLREQEAAMRAGGYASLEDMLLNVKDRTQIGWLKPPNRVSTEDGLIQVEYDDDNTSEPEEPREEFGDERTIESQSHLAQSTQIVPSTDPVTSPSVLPTPAAVSQPKIRVPEAASTSQKVRAGTPFASTEVSASQKARAAAAAAAPPVEPSASQKARAAAAAAPIAPADAATSSGRIRAPSRDASALPTARGLMAAPGSPLSNEGLVPFAEAGPTATTKKRFALDPAQRRLTRNVVAVSLGLAVGTLVLSLLFLPDEHPSGPVGAAATLEIQLDRPGILSVDGREQPEGSRAVLGVEAGVQHQVTVQRSGYPVYTTEVGPFEPGERKTVKITLPK